MTFAPEQIHTTAEHDSAVVDRGPRLSTVFTLVFAAGGLAVGIRPLHDNSFMWHLRTGRLILDRGIPHHDPYSYTAAGAKWVAQSWLAELLYGVVNRVSGGLGLRLLGAVVGFAVGYLLFRIAWHGARDRVRAGGLALLALASMLNVWSERPLMFGLLAMLALVIIVEEPETWIARHSLLTMPALMWLWANTHGTFVIGVGYLALHLVGRALEGHPPNRARERDLGRAGAIAAAVTLLNPYFLDLVLFPLNLMARGEVLRDVSEWQSPNFREPGAMLFGAFIVCTLIVLARKRPGTRDLVVTVVFVVLGLWAIRNVGLAVIAVLPVLSRLLRRDVPRPDTRGSAHRLMIVALCCTIALAVVKAAGEDNWDLKTYPVAAYKAIEQQDLAGRRLYTTDAWGGYLIASQWPRQKVFFDDRYDMYPIEINRDYSTIANVEVGWHDALDRHGVEVVMSPAKSALVQALLEREDWQVVHRDNLAVVFARRTLAAP
jgi:hypothetical protein